MPKFAPIGSYAQNQALRLGEKTALKRPKRDRIGITATGLELEQDPRTQSKS